MGNEKNPMNFCRVLEEHTLVIAWGIWSKTFKGVRASDQFRLQTASLPHWGGNFRSRRNTGELSWGFRLESPDKIRGYLLCSEMFITTAV